MFQHKCVTGPRGCPKAAAATAYDDRHAISPLFGLTSVFYDILLFSIVVPIVSFTTVTLTQRQSHGFNSRYRICIRSDQKKVHHSLNRTRVQTRGEENPNFQSPVSN